MSNYNIILNLFSLVLVLSILFIVIYGCQFKKYNNKRIERFTDVNENEYNNENENNIDIIETAKIKNDNNEKNKITGLEGFEGKILDGLNNGTINDMDMKKLIETGTFTKDNLENIIKYVENFKNKNGIPSNI